MEVPETAEPEASEPIVTTEEPAATMPAEDDLPEQIPTAAEPKPRDLDPEVKDILQEEAAHETRMRAEESGGLETQPDLGLDDTTDDAERRAEEARARMERLKGPDAEPSIEDAVATATAAAKNSRRDRLPDIDEINSSLRRSETPTRPIEETDTLSEEVKRKRGFARGFAIPLLIVALLVLLYANAPTIAEAVPALGPALNSYVLMVDQLRVWLDGQISAFMP